jgi:energy-coupling factor transporter transmembrane protein EcfT
MEFSGSNSSGGLQPSPRLRFIATALAIVGTLMARDLTGLGVVWLTLTAVCIIARIGLRHLRFVAVVILPITVALVLIWGVMIGAPPNEAAGSNQRGAFAFACLTGMRLAVLGGILQICFLTIPGDEVLSTFQACGVRGDAAAVLVGTLAIGPELKLRANQVLSARYARGLVADRRIASSIKQLPFLLRPLLAWVLRSALQRGEIWRQRNLLDRLAKLQSLTPSHSLVSGGIFLVLASAWLLYNVTPYVSTK